MKLSLLTRTVSLFALTFLARAAAAQPENEAVRFEYSAPAGCPDVDAFATRVQARTSRARLGGPGELARTFLVGVRTDDDGASARLEFTDVRGTAVVRAVRGDTCDEVVSAIALVTALAIEAGTVDAGEAAPPRDIEPRQAAAAPARVAPAAPRKRARAPRPEVVAWSFGIETGVTSWLGPPPALGVGVFGDVGAYAGASARITLLRSTSSTLVAVPASASSYRRADFTALVARLEGCPLAALLGSGFRVVPCLGLGLGALEGAGEEATVDPSRSGSIFWADLVPTLRVDWTVSDSLVFFGQGELGLPLVRHEFVFDGPRQDVFIVPALGAGATAGLAWRFQ